MQHFDGSVLSLAWIVPFAGLLLSIAILPAATPRFWEHRFDAVAAFWAAAFVAPCLVRFGAEVAAGEVWHTAVLEFLPFLILVFALFVVAGGIRIVGNLVGTPVTNTAILALGTLAASVLGTTGASMLLIRPLIRANADRRRNAHVFVFFIFLVANIGGSLTPLGDPPLFLGFLKGVDFFWTTRALAGPMAVASAILLVLFFALDWIAWRSEPAAPRSRVPRQIRVEGLHNILYLALIILAVLGSGLWKTGVAVPLGMDTAAPLEGLARDAVLLGIGILSWRTTRRSIRIENAFAWTPIREVAILFAGIFITIIPALAILRAGERGAFAPLIGLVTHRDGTPIEAAYFWLVGGLSSVLDNAPTYLVFFNLAGSDPNVLMGPLARTLTAISAGAVFMGANTYIGNAPNFMIKAICEEHGVRMPSFFGYMVWSATILLPIFCLESWLYFL